MALLTLFLYVWPAASLTYPLKTVCWSLRASLDLTQATVLSLVIFNEKYAQIFGQKRGSIFEMFQKSSLLIYVG